MYETSIQYWEIANNAGTGYYNSKVRRELLKAETHERQRAAASRTLQTIVESVFRGLIDGFLSPRLDYRAINKAA